MGAWVLATQERGLAAAACVASGAGPVQVLVVGPRSLAERAAALDVERVHWVEPADDTPAEAYAAAAAAAVAAAALRLVVATGDPATRALAGAVAAATRAAVLAGGLSVTVEGDRVLVERSALGGAAVATVAVEGPVVVVGALGDDDAAPADASAPVQQLVGEPRAGVAVRARRPVARAAGLADAARVVSVGRGLRARADLELVGTLLDLIGAELACSMPVADDLGWVPKERYVGRSGQQISPRLYLALGISGAPQHLEGIRGAKVVVAVNSDPTAPVFRRADYGVVGDLYEIVPALVDAWKNA